MSFSSPLGLLALAAIPAILFLHLFRRQLRERSVAGLFLFAPRALQAAAGRKRTRLLRTASLWLELAAALLAALWLAGLEFGVGRPPDHLVLVLDDSASMQARSLAGSADERARERARELAGELSRNAVVTVLRTGRRPEIALGPRAPLATLAATLTAWQPRSPAHDPASALALGRELATPHDTLHFLTDTPQPVPPEYRLHAVGAALPNVAISGARRTRDGDAERIEVDVLAFATDAIETRVTVRAPGADEPLAQRAITATPGRAASLALTIPTSSAAIEVTLDDDALTIDNRTLLLPEPSRVVAVAVTVGAETRRLLSIDRVLGALDQVRLAADPQRADVVLTATPTEVRALATELLVAAPGEERDAWIGPFLLERRHALLRGITLDGVVWSAAAAPPDAGTTVGLPIISAGAVPLLTERTDGESTRLHLNLDPARSNLPASPDWPILLANITDQARAKLPGPVHRNVLLGDAIEFRHTGPRADAADLRLIEPDGTTRPARGLRLLSWEARQPGLHRLLDAAGAELATFAVQFVDPHESDLTQHADLDRAAERELVADDEADRAGGGALERRLLALLLLGVVLADWIVVRRLRG